MSQYDFQLVYVYLFDSYSGIADVGIPLTDGMEFSLLKHISAPPRDWNNLTCTEDEFHFLVKRDGNRTGCSKTFFDEQRRLRRIDVLLGMNGTGKTTILRSIARGTGRGIEIYYSEDRDEFRFSGPHVKYIDRLEDYKVCLCVAGSTEVKRLEEIDRVRRAFYYAPENRPLFLWKDENESEPRLSLTYENIGRYLFAQRDSPNPFLPRSSCEFTFQFGMLGFSPGIQQPPDIISVQKCRDCAEHYFQKKDVPDACYILESQIEMSFDLMLSNYAKDYTHLLRKGDTWADCVKKLRECYRKLLVWIQDNGNTNGMEILAKRTFHHDASKAVDDDLNRAALVLALRFQIDNPAHREPVIKLLKIADSMIPKPSLGIDMILNSFLGFRCGFGEFSAGEMALLELNANLYKMLSEAYEDTRTKPGLVLLLLDEPEGYLHPAWSQGLIKNIIREILNFYDDHPDWESICQVVMTSHTPYLVSDLLPCFVKKLRKEDNGQVVVEEARDTFAANVYTILQDSFFLENPIGQFAREKLDRMIQEIRSDRPLSETDRDIIDQIGDPYLRHRLSAMARRGRLGP